MAEEHHGQFDFVIAPCNGGQNVERLSPRPTATQKAASEFVKNRDLDIGFNPYELAAIAYEAPDPPGQMKIVKLLVAIRNLRYHSKQGRHSKREMDLRNETDLSHVLFEFNTALADDQDCNYPQTAAYTFAKSSSKLQSYLLSVTKCRFGKDSKS